MTVGTNTFIDNTMLEMLRCNVDVDTATLVAVLVLDTHTANAVTDLTYAQISGDECADADYLALSEADRTLSGVAWALNGTRNFLLTANAVDFAPGDDDTISAKYCYIVERIGGALAGTDRIVSFIDLKTEGAPMPGSIDGDFLVGFGTGLASVTLTP